MRPRARGAPCCTPETQVRAGELFPNYGTKPALRHVSLRIYRACITALIGPSGCGKTSLLSSLNRLTDMIPGCRVEGRIVFDGQDIRDPRLDVQALRRRIGMIF